MTRRRHAQLTLGQLVLYGMVMPQPEMLMEPALRRINELLEDEALIDEVTAVLGRRWPQSQRRGRYGTPAEVVLRMLVLKHLRDWSYERLHWEVTGNFVYRRFCRIDAEKVPDDKTLVKLGKLLDEPVLRAMFDRVVQCARDEGVTRGEKLRVDTTVVEAPIHYPTDSSLCEDAIRFFQRQLERLVALGIKLPFALRRVGRSVAHRASEIAQALRLRGEKAKNAIKKPYRGLLRITGRMIRQARKACEAVREQVGRWTKKARAKAASAVAAIEEILPRARQVVRQSRARVIRGVTDSPGKLISIFEPYAQILRRGKLHKATEFGMLVKIQEAEGGIVTDVALVPGKADAPLLVPSIEKHIEAFGRAPKIVATDRGFYSTEGERRIRELGVRRAVIPRPGHRSKSRVAHERQRWFRRGRAWRAGGEARISRLKHHFGMARSPYKGDSGIARTVFWAGIANNLMAIGRS